MTFLEKNKRLVIIDSNSLIHRAYHALPRLTTKQGELMNAVYGFLLVFFRAIKEFKPDYLAAAFDLPGPTFRHEKYKEYKAKRPPAPPELYKQIPKVKEILQAFNAAVFEKAGFEADDIIGTIANLAQKKQAFPKIETIILSGDLDALQLINPHTRVYALRKGVKDIILYDEKSVAEKFQGLTPRQLLDFKALRGDPSDNIPGVTGVGEKTAIKLLSDFGSLDDLYQEIEENSAKTKKISPKLRETLIKYKEQAMLSRDLARIDKHVPIEVGLKNCRFGQYDKNKVITLFKNWEFHSLISRLENNQEEKKQGPIGENLRLW